MNEKKYLHSVLGVIGENIDPVNAVEKLEELKEPDGEYSVNTALVISEIGILDFEREYGDLDYVPTEEQSGAFIEAEIRIANDSIETIKTLIGDFESGNLYAHIYSLHAIYSRFLEDGAYTSIIAFYELKATSREEAEAELEEIKPDIPRKLPKDSRYGIEDIQIKDRIVDKNGKEINAGSTIIG
jgi:hypothetical protein